MFWLFYCVDGGVPVHIIINYEKTALTLWRRGKNSVKGKHCKHCLKSQQSQRFTRVGLTGMLRSRTGWIIRGHWQIRTAPYFSNANPSSLAGGSNDKLEQWKGTMRPSSSGCCELSTGTMEFQLSCIALCCVQYTISSGYQPVVALLVGALIGLGRAWHEGWGGVFHQYYQCYHTWRCSASCGGTSAVSGR